MAVQRNNVIIIMLIPAITLYMNFKNNEHVIWMTQNQTPFHVWVDEFTHRFSFLFQKQTELFKLDILVSEFSPVGEYVKW